MQDHAFELTPQGRNRLADYNHARPFANFFPAVAGLYGIPYWVMFTNRGQCISSFGLRNRAQGMLNFSAANEAYRDTSRLGFRTFLKVAAGGQKHLYEPFADSPANREMGCTNELGFDPASLEITETNAQLGIAVEASFQTVPGEAFGGLLRRVTVTNTGSAPATLEWVDGLPWVTCYGIDWLTAKLMPYTSKATILLRGVEAGRPYFQLWGRTADRPGVEHMTRGNFALHYDAQGLLPAIVDPQAVFGPETGFAHPAAFADTDAFEVPDRQRQQNDIPCAMTFLRVSLPPQQKKTLWAVFGQDEGEDRLKTIAERVTGPDWYEEKTEQNRGIMRSICDRAATFSAEPVFDGYCRCTFLDNVLRGGLPITLPDRSGRRRTYHVFSRKHGDMEREYNDFAVEPEFWSQGNGGYRDVLQNRRNDVYINVDSGLEIIRAFTSMLRLDGFNPHGLEGSEFYLADASEAGSIASKWTTRDPDRQALEALLAKPFTPGSILTTVQVEGIGLTGAPIDLLADVMARSDRHEVVDSHSGFWTDHWHYNLDSIDAFLSVYPDRLAELLLSEDSDTYQHSQVRIRPRHRRFGFWEGKPLELHFLDMPEEKAESRDCILRTEGGSGEVYRTTLFAKFFGLVIVKMASLDPSGRGLEMEAGRPNWNDSLDGLAGQFGSSSCETIELLRLVNKLLEWGPKVDLQRLAIPSELAILMQAVDKALDAAPGSDRLEDLMAYWDATNTAKEHFREVTADGIDGAEADIASENVYLFLRSCKQRLEEAIHRCVDPETGLLDSYFYCEITDYRTEEWDGETCLFVTGLEPHRTAPFLEGPVHYLRVIDEPDAAARQHRAVRQSGIYDRQLGMYKVCASVAGESEALGRIVLFQPGWLERESVWLHMEYKYMLEVLRSGLWEDFKEDLRKAAVCFQPAGRYGRSVLENSSFIVPTNYPDPADHGRGFYARLSGSTAEWVHMWIHMAVGARPFELDDRGELVFRPSPSLPSWLFAAEARNVKWQTGQTLCSTELPANHYAVCLFSSTLLIYVNPTGKDTAGDDPARPKSAELKRPDGTVQTCPVGEIRGELAGAVRNGEFETVTITLG